MRGGEGLEYHKDERHDAGEIPLMSSSSRTTKKDVLAVGGGGGSGEHVTSTFDYFALRGCRFEGATTTKGMMRGRLVHGRRMSVREVFFWGEP